MYARQTHVGADEFVKGTNIKPERLNKLFMHLFQRTNEFLDLMERKNQPGEGYRYLFQAYARLGVEKSVQNKEFKKAYKVLEKPPIQHENQHLKYHISHQFHLDHIYVERRSIPVHIVENQHLLDQYYVGGRLKYLCATRNMEWVFNLPRQPLNEAEIVAIYKHPDFAPNTVSTAYFLVLHLFSNPSDILTQLDEINLYLRENDDAIPFNDRQDLWGYVLNYCMFHLSKKGERFEAIADEVYVHLYEKGLILDEGKLSSFHFTNMVKIRLDNGAFEWIAALLEDIDRDSIIDVWGSAVEYAWALYHYHSGDFPRAVSAFKALLSDPPTDIFYNLELRTMLLKSFFANRQQLQAAERDEMEALTEAFRMLLILHY
ncbi:MAG: hypothetical protein AAF570_14840 [Bacteroidota bacterium]